MWAELSQQRIKRQAEAAKERHEHLSQNYASLYEVMTRTESVVSRNNMKRQLDSLMEEIEQVEDELKSLDEERKRFNANLRRRVREEVGVNYRNSSLERIDRTIVTVSPHQRSSRLPQHTKLPQHRGNRQSSSIRFSARGWEYVLAGCTTVILLIVWKHLGDLSHTVPDHPNNLESSDIIWGVGQLGIMGGLLTGFSLSLFVIFQNYLRQHSFRINWVKLFAYCMLSMIVGGLSWISFEFFIHSQNNPSLYGEGGEKGAIVCIFLSLCMLWFPLSFSTLRNR